ncbi:MAG: tRNA (N6-isopentenyl adenosine(37)-C2)-methylthiotransferase MiaB [Pseudomonadota bacterium]
MTQQTAKPSTDRIVATGPVPSTSSGTQRKRAFIKSYGCQMNVYDSERMAAALTAEGYEIADGPEGTDLVVLNTCHIREKAAEKVYSELGRLKPLREARAAEGGKLTLAVAGCVAQAEGAEIIARQPAVDVVVGPQAYHRLPAMVRAAEAGTRSVDTDFPAEDKFDHLAPDTRANRNPSAFLTVQEGCDKFCTFCVVPYTRGAEVSRPAARIIAEAEALVARGVREITLLGQNVNAWHGTPEPGMGAGLGGLIRRLARIEGLARIRYTTSHPRDMDEGLIAAHGEEAKLMPYLHLPVQAGADRILQAMNRGHTAASYIDLVAKIRAARPDLALSGDFIVGFPGETDAEFEDTLALVREITYAQAYSFKYSPRPGTPAATREDQVSEAVKSDRLTRLQALLAEQQSAFQRSKIGQRMAVLLEKPGRHAGQMVGRSPWLQPVHLAATPEQKGQILTVEITGAGSNSLSAIAV